MNCLITCFHPQPNISQHLKLLLEAGLVQVEQRGHLCCYSLTEPCVEKVPVVLDGAISDDGAGKGDEIRNAYLRIRM